MIYRFLMWFFRHYFKWSGWSFEGEIPKGVNKAVMVAGGHTSNWDLIYSLGTMAILDVPFSFMIKQEALRFPIKNFLLSLGAIPILRDGNGKTNYVEQLSKIFEERETMYLCMAPEGTRSAVREWKTGYFHIAKRANVPIILCYLDYPKKKTFVGKVISPDGEEEQVMAEMKSYFKRARPMYPEKFLL